MKRPCKLFLTDLAFSLFIGFVAIYLFLALVASFTPVSANPFDFAVGVLFQLMAEHSWKVVLLLLLLMIFPYVLVHGWMWLDAVTNPAEERRWRAMLLVILLLCFGLPWVYSYPEISQWMAGLALKSTP